MARIDRSAHSSPRGSAAAHRQGPLRRRHRASRPAACRVRAQPASARRHPQGRCPGRARAAGVHAVLTLDDLAPVLAKRRMLRHSNSGTPLDRYWSFALADGEVSYVGEAVAIVVADDRYVAEDAAALVEVDYEVLPAVSDCRKAAVPGAPAVRRELNTQHRRHLQGRLWRCRSRLPQGRARLPRGAVAASRRRPSDRRPRPPRANGATAT